MALFFRGVQFRWCHIHVVKELKMWNGKNRFIITFTTQSEIQSNLKMTTIYFCKFLVGINIGLMIRKSYQITREWSIRKEGFRKLGEIWYVFKSVLSRGREYDSTVISMAFIPPSPLRKKNVTNFFNPCWVWFGERRKFCQFPSQGGRGGRAVSSEQKILFPGVSSHFDWILEVQCIFDGYSRDSVMQHIFQRCFWSPN